MPRVVIPVGPDDPPAVALLASLWPYFVTVANRKAPRYGVEPDDILHELSVYVLRVGRRLDRAGRPVPPSFRYWACRRVLRRRFAHRLIRQWASGDGTHGRAKTARVLSREPDPAAAAELADDLAAVQRALPRLTTKRRAAVDLRFGLATGGAFVAGAALAAALGIHPNSAGERLRAGLRELADAIGADPRAAAPDVGEGITSGKLAGRLPTVRRKPRKRKRKPAAAGVGA